MKRNLVFIISALCLSANAQASLPQDWHPTRDMDDVHSLSVVYINRNHATPPPVELTAPPVETSTNDRG